MAIEGGPATSNTSNTASLVRGNKGILKVTKIEDGKPVPEMVATKIDRKPVSDDAFSRPQATPSEDGRHDEAGPGAMKQMQEKMKDKGRSSAEPPRWAPGRPGTALGPLNGTTRTYKIYYVSSGEDNCGEVWSSPLLYR